MLVKSGLATALDLNAGAKESLDLTYNQYLIFARCLTKW